MPLIQIRLLEGAVSEEDKNEMIARVSDPTLTIADLYRCRWQVGIFFKWIKQQLRIKEFYGTNENVIRTQIYKL